MKSLSQTARAELVRTLRFGVSVVLFLFIVFAVLAQFNEQLVLPHVNPGWLLVIALAGMSGLVFLGGVPPDADRLSVRVRFSLAVVVATLTVVATVPVVARYNAHWLWAAVAGALAFGATLVLTSTPPPTDDPRQGR